MRIIKQFSLFLSLGLLMTILTGCPYSAVVPLDKANVQVDEALLGKWVKASQFDENEAELDYDIFEKKDAYSYIITEYKFDQESKEHKLDKTFHAHITLIEGIEFMNFKPQEDEMMDNDKYYFQKLVRVSEKQIELHEVTDNIKEEFTDSEALRKFFAKHAKLSFFYNKDSQLYNKAG